MGAFKFKTYFYPGKTFNDIELASLTNELREVASVCFDECPDYQSLTGKREELSRAIITTAREKKSGKLMGFVSALMLEGEYEERFLHLGLTCARPEARGKKLTHKLTGKTIMKVLLRRVPFSSLWISNCACVLSSLGNVALYFEELSPSPYGPAPTFRHLSIARAISKNYRVPIAIAKEAVLNEDKLVFEGSVPGTIFAKDPRDSRFHHRDPAITNYYLNLLDFERGDEAIQIGRVSFMTFPKYILKRRTRKSTRSLPQLAQA